MNLKHYQHLLEESKRQLEDQMEVLSLRGTDPLNESVGELSSYDNHPADLGSETFEREKDLGLKGNAKVMLMKVNHALDQIKNGAYGICEKCGKAIDEERLEAIPYTTFCVECKRAEEKPRDHSKRPIEEEVLTYPFGRSFLDSTGKNEFDGEDTWQEVARYGTSEGPQDVPEAVDYDDVYIDSDERRGIVERANRIIDNVDYDDRNELGW